MQESLVEVLKHSLGQFWKWTGKVVLVLFFPFAFTQCLSC